MQPLLVVNGVSKCFGSISALQPIDFKINPGEVVGAVGRSGAGKSVLGNILSGTLTPDSGEIIFARKRLVWPFRAEAYGIETIYQIPQIVDHRDIASNVFLGRELVFPITKGWLNIADRKKMNNRVSQMFDQLGVSLPSLRIQAAHLSIEQRQIIAIARAIARQDEIRLLIIDEPTVILEYSRQLKLISLIQDWQKAGIAILFFSNDLDHLFAVTDKMIVLRKGKKVKDCRTDEITREEIVSALVRTSDQQQLTPAIWALENYYNAREQAENLNRKQELLHQSLEEQDGLNKQLVEQLGVQLQALDQANQALQNAHIRLLTERELERKHLAREIHDQVIQDLLSVNYLLEAIETDNKELPSLKTARDEIKLSVDNLRQICSDLRPPTIDSLGLSDALLSYALAWEARTGIRVNLDLAPEIGRMPEVIELSIFRIIQEGLNNVHKHAHASQVQVTLHPISPRALMVSIQDNGAGLADNFDLASLTESGHFGLLGISERASLLGGRLRFSNQSQGGALLQVEIPHPRTNRCLPRY